jgi:hypothetical protein
VPLGAAASRRPFRRRQTRKRPLSARLSQGGGRGASVSQVIRRFFTVGTLRRSRRCLARPSRHRAATDRGAPPSVPISPSQMSRGWAHDRGAVLAASRPAHPHAPAGRRRAGRSSVPGQHGEGRCRGRVEAWRDLMAFRDEAAKAHATKRSFPVDGAASTPRLLLERHRVIAPISARRLAAPAPAW